MPFNANDYRLRLNINGTRTLVLNDVVPVTISDTNNKAQFIYGVSSASVTFDGYLDYSSTGLNTVDLFDKLLDGTLVTISSGVVAESFGAEGYITDMSQQGSSDELASVSFTIQLTGDITRESLLQLQELCIEGVTLCINADTLQVNTIIE